MGGMIGGSGRGSGGLVRCGGCRKGVGETEENSNGSKQPEGERENNSEMFVWGGERVRGRTEAVESRRHPRHPNAVQDPVAT